MKELISVIVPIYNSARYLRDCAASVLEQTYTYFELLLIDDGSEDNSREICKELCVQDERIRLVCREHKGVSAARNAGIEEAQGKYVFFLDSDDIIHPQLLEALHGLMEKEGAAIGTERRYRAGEEGFERPREWKEEDISALENMYLKNEEALECRTFASSKTALSGIGGKMVQKSAVGEVRFHETLTHGEDTLFMYQVLAGGADVAVLCRDWYCYRKHGDGTISKLTVKGCDSIYRAECMIRDQEMSAGREENALTWELAIVNTIIGWYKAGKKDDDTDLMRYVKSKVDIEKEQEIFPRLTRLKRLEFGMLTYCYPFSEIHSVFPYLARGIYCIYFTVVRIMYFLRRVIAFPGICYRKILNQVHIHRWRVRWAYKNAKWKVKWLVQMTWIIIRRSIWKVMDMRHFIMHREERLDGKEER
jgi:Glycosyltransferases involved in cell wall biogenesis